MAVFSFHEISPRALITFTKASSPDLRIHVGTQVFVPGIETQIYETPHPSDPKQAASLEITAFVLEPRETTERRRYDRCSTRIRKVCSPSTPLAMLPGNRIPIWSSPMLMC